MFHEQQQWRGLDDSSADIGHQPEPLESIFAMGGENPMLRRNTLEHDIFTSQDYAKSDAPEWYNEPQEKDLIENACNNTTDVADQEFEKTEEDQDDVSKAVSLLVRGRSITKGLGNVLMSSLESFNGLSAISDQLRPRVRPRSERIKRKKSHIQKPLVTKQTSRKRILSR